MSDWQQDELGQALAFRYVHKFSQQSESKFKPGLIAQVYVPSEYVAPFVDLAFATHPAMFEVRDGEHAAAEDDDQQRQNALPDLIWDEYENLDWPSILKGRVIANSYCVRKGLSRKAQLSIYLSKYIKKHPTCQLTKSLPKTLVVDTWEAFDRSLAQMGIPFRQRLESCLWEVGQAFDQTPDAVWIMKPSATNKGAEVNVITSYNQFRDIIFKWTDIREWVVQEYLARPLLLNKRKFHIRVYVLALGCLQVFVYQQCLVLCAMNAYDTTDFHQAFSHITNTYQQQSHPSFVESECVLLLEDLDQFLHDAKHPKASQAKATILDQINTLMGEVFDAYKGEFSVFQPLANCFELYGVDFLVDEDLRVWLLELNPGPDFQQTGTRLNFVIQGLMKDTLAIATDHFFSASEEQVKIQPESLGDFVQVYDQAWGFRAKETASMKFHDD